MENLKNLIQKLSIIHQVQTNKLKNDFIVDNELNLLSLKEANPEYYETHQMVLNSFAEFIQLLKIYDEQSPEAFKKAIIDGYKDKEIEFTNLIFSVVSFSHNINYSNNSHKEALDMFKNNETLDFRKEDNIPKTILPFLQKQLKDIMPIFYETGIELFPESVE